MDNHYQEYSRLMALAGRRSVLSDPALDFAGLCRLAGAGQEEMEKCIQSELGLSGEELIARLRQQYFDSKDKK